ncbi:DNA polymerase III subunit delta' [Pseudoalteromonas citrea]|uniref:diguanylate cyclase n=1 Tax=Pseudoalteromonas citrea TaxID=43655 RepID=A0A5S3XMC9_9GAMM|nr:GGDEF domain-containing protein [Pseudoalteromonas citrea]TMP43776.1 DNA polymerase III subunit delta' [Pseudoalteromonas citrea]TMP55327.1 DNA polymerase III subunit delta' [Pseudoalteromonas citrea]
MQHPHSQPDIVEQVKLTLLKRVAWYCLGLHVLLLIVFSLLNIVSLALLNIGSVITWWAGIYLLKHKQRSFALRLFSVEVAVHAVSVCAVLGMALGFQYYLWTVSCLLLLDSDMKLKPAVVVSTLMITLFAALHIWFADVTYNYAFEHLLPYVHFTNVLVCGVPMIFTVALIREVTMKQRLSLELLAAKDPLTHMYNRRYALELITHAKYHCDENNETLCIIMADIDHFKRINDNYGHAQGDEVLKRVALLIDKHTRPVDICARWGGEEFLLVMPNCTQKTALHRIEKLRSAITFEIFEHFDRPVTLSFGVTLWPTSSSFDAALHHADNALYTSKQNGRNQVTAASSLYAIPYSG